MCPRYHQVTEYLDSFLDDPFLDEGFVQLLHSDRRLLEADLY